MVYLQYRPTDDAAQRLDPFAVVVTSNGAISGRSWRRVPFADIGMHVAMEPAREILMEPAQVDAPSVERLDAYFTETAPKYAKLSSLIPAHPASPEAGPGSPPPLRAPDGRITDEFLQELADSYRWFIAAKRPPAPSIAALTGAPVRTVHRWVSEARKRDFLPPARRGQAG
ncbi:hypothetical protein EAO71_07150 [Streptomyces sp. ms191]|nr:hypothetical protein EAO71_07150 [Streptomyces sp. ms191]